MFIIIFSVTWPNIRMAYWKAHLDRGICEPVRQYAYVRSSMTDSSYAGDPLLWFFSEQPCGWIFDGGMIA